MRRYLTYSELKRDAAKIDCCQKVESERFPNFPDPEETTVKKPSIIENEGLSLLDILEIKEANRTIKWFK